MSEAAQQSLRQVSRLAPIGGLGNSLYIALALYSIALISVLDLYLARSLLHFSPLILEATVTAILFVAVPFPAMGAYSRAAGLFIFVGFLAGLCSSLFNIDTFSRSPFDAILFSALSTVVFTFWWIGSAVIYRYLFKIAVISLWLLLSSVIADVLWPGILTNSLFRPAGFPANPNITALLSSLLLVTILYEPKSRRAMRFACVMAAVTITAFSASRFGILALVLTVSIYLIFLATLAERAAILVSAVAAVVLFLTIRDGTFLSQSANISNRLDLGTSLFDAYEIRSQVLFDYLWSAADCNPMFGCGYAAYEQQEVHGHNTLLNTFFKGGLLQLMTVVGLVMTVLWAAIVVGKPKELTIGAIIVGALFVHNDLLTYPLVAFCVVAILRSADAVVNARNQGLRVR